MHYIFDKLKFMKFKFKRTEQILYQDLLKILNDPSQLKKLYATYNILNSHYSCIKYKFLSFFSCGKMQWVPVRFLYLYL